MRQISAASAAFAFVAVTVWSAAGPQSWGGGAIDTGLVASLGGRPNPGLAIETGFVPSAGTGPNSGLWPGPGTMAGMPPSNVAPGSGVGSGAGSGATGPSNVEPEPTTVGGGPPIGPVVHAPIAHGDAAATPDPAARATTATTAPSERQRVLRIASLQERVEGRASRSRRSRRVTVGPCERELRHLGAARGRSCRHAIRHGLG